jgi:hypothetical protein
MRQTSEAVAAPFLADVIDWKGFIEPGRFSEVLRVTKGELASASGLSRDAVSKATRLGAPATQARLREVAEIINGVLPWCGSVQQAFAWYRSQPIPAFGTRRPRTWSARDGLGTFSITSEASRSAPRKPLPPRRPVCRR